MGTGQRHSVRLSFYCTTCLPGYHLPYLSAAANGLFAEIGLDVELLDPPGGGPDNIERVGAGGADFCLTSVTHYLTARARGGDIPARFAAVVVQRSPMAALVADGSPIATPADLAGCRLGGPLDSHLVADYQTSLDHLGIGRSQLVPMDYLDAWDALAEGRVDAVADYVDVLPRLRRMAGVAARAVPLGIEVYSSGLVAADRLSDDEVAEMCKAVVAALERQRLHPEEGMDALQRRYPDVDRSAALEGWALVEPNIFTDVPTGSMDADRWAATVEFVSAAQGLAPVPPESVYRPAFAGVPTP
ncbi:MAG TPA: ABC transporter substrate-binding protein [Acidimicrobiales bacterium]|nr:ABC transporter substrate-binding protein [Acidimicrobiales bacterium]